MIEIDGNAQSDWTAHHAMTSLSAASSTRLEDRSTASSMSGGGGEERSEATPSSSVGSSHASDADAESCFFADATLDLGEAHDLAEDEHRSAASSLTVDDHTDPRREDEDDEDDDVEMRRLDGGRRYGRVEAGGVGGAGARPRFRPRRPRHARDGSWALALAVALPSALTLAHRYRPTPYEETADGGWARAADSPQAFWYTLLPTTLLTAALLRSVPLLWRALPGGDGADARAAAAATLDKLVTASPWTHAGLTAAIFLATPRAWIYCAPPLAAVLVHSLVHRERPTDADDAEGRRGAWGALLPHRRALLRTVTETALDVSGRSLRRRPFARAVGAVLFAQWAWTIVWRSALRRVLGSDAAHRFATAVVLLIVGEWTRAVLTRTLGFVASGGIACWFAHQNLVFEERRCQRQTTDDANRARSSKRRSNDLSSVDTASDDYSVGYGNSHHGYSHTNVQEAYRTVDASAYTSVDTRGDIVDEKGPNGAVTDCDDDDYSVHGNFFADGAPRPTLSTETDWKTDTDVGSFLLSAFTTSFGSIVKCAATGAVAEFLWFWLDFGARRREERSDQNASRRRDMPVGSSLDHRRRRRRRRGAGRLLALRARLDRRLLVLSARARAFVRDHADHGLGHAAAYHRPYSRAAREVSDRLRAAGVVPALRDDASPTAARAVVSAIAGTWTLVFFCALVATRDRARLSDANVCEILAVEYLLCWGLATTWMEPLRASARAVYVGFARCPEAVREASPLLYQRLARVARANREADDDHDHDDDEDSDSDDEEDSDSDDDDCQEEDRNTAAEYGVATSAGEGVL